MPKPVELVENRRDCAMLERHSRFDVMLHGKKVEQLYFNMRGYVGSLPLPGGKWLSIGEKSITAYRKEVAKINREWKEVALVQET